MGRPKGVKKEAPVEGQVEDKLEQTSPSLDEASQAEDSVAKDVLPASKPEPRLKSPEQEMEVKQEGDYLQKYQYRKQTLFGSLASNPVPGSKAEKMKKFLLASPKVRMFIPQTPGEDKSIPQSVTLNGYRLDFPKNAYVDVPEPVANVLMESLKQTELAIERSKISGDKRKESALS